MNQEDARVLDRLASVANELSERQPKLVLAALDGTLTSAQLREIIEQLDRLARGLSVRAHELDGNPAVAGALKPPAPRQTTRSRPDATRPPADS